MEETNGIFCNRAIYCYCEEQGDALESFVAQYDSDSVIHVFSSVIESCERNLFYCLGDIINNYIEDKSEKIWFVTDIKFLSEIVKKVYPFLFEKIIYIEQNIKQTFDKKFDINGLINYFLDIQKSKLNALFMRNLWKLKDSVEPQDYTRFLYEFDKIEIDREGKIAKMWCCFCTLLIYEIDVDKKKNSFHLKLILYSIIMQLSKDANYTNTFLDMILSYDMINEENLYFVWSQFQRISSKQLVVFDEKTNELLNEMYDRCYNSLVDKLKECLVKIPHEERDKDVVMIFTMQFLNTAHGITRTVAEKAKALSRAGKKVVIVNTCEHYTMRGYLPMYRTGYGRVLKDYYDIETVKVKNFHMQFLQLHEEYSVQYNMQILANLIREVKPYYILSVGTGSILTDLCKNILPCASMVLERFFLDDDAIENQFTFKLKKQEKKFTRKELDLPEDKFILVITSINQQYKDISAFVEILEKVCQNGCYVVFTGIKNNYSDLIENYPTISKYSSFIGDCDDMLALMEISDLYVSPDRNNSDFSVIEAFSRKVPGVYLSKGDACIVGGEEFAVNSFDEMDKQIIKYKEDKEYYNQMANLAKKRANLMISADGTMVDIDRQICKKIEEKYW